MAHIQIIPIFIRIEMASEVDLGQASPSYFHLVPKVQLKEQGFRLEFNTGSL